MDTTWILVAHRGGARLFENKGLGKGLNLLEDIPHPQGKLRNQDIDSDQPGRSFDRFGQGRHALGTEQEPKEHLAELFAKELADLLENGRNQHRYQRLVLIAGPDFLGVLRSALNAQVTALVTSSLAKNLANVNATDIPPHLRDIVNV